MKIKHIGLGLWLLVLTSCAAHFNRFPGTALAEFPEEMQGNYYMATKPSFFYWFKPDTASIRITAKGVYPVQPDSADFPLMLGDSVVFSKVGPYYALSQRDENIPGAWTVSVIKIDKNTLYAVNIEENKPYSKHLLDHFTSESLIRNPQQEWVKATTDSKTKLRNMEHSHSDSAVVFQMDETQLIHFIEKHLVKEKPMRLKRIN